MPTVKYNHTSLWLAGLTAFEFSPNRSGNQALYVKSFRSLLGPYSFFSVWQLNGFRTCPHDEANISTRQFLCYSLFGVPGMPKLIRGDKLADEVTESIKGDKNPIKTALIWLVLVWFVLVIKVSRIWCGAQ